MAIPPFGAAPTPKATSSKYGTVTLSQISSPTPTSMFSSLTIPSNTQTLFRQHIVTDGYAIILGTNASLIGV